MVDKLMVAVEMVEMVNQISFRNGPLASHPSKEMVYSNMTPKINGQLQNGSKLSVLLTVFWVSILAPHTFWPPIIRKWLPLIMNVLCGFLLIIGGLHFRTP